MDVHATVVGFAGLADYFERSFRPVAEQKKLGFEIEISDGLPETMTTDEQRLQQIVKNLLSNAFKFTDEGSVVLRVSRAGDGLSYGARTLNDADHVIAFTVTDSGIGISEDKLRLIFESFQQADGTTSRKYGGTGLGLSISREIARLLGGEIRVESKQGEGSTFTLYLPSNYVPLEEPGSAEPGRPASVALLAGNGEPGVSGASLDLAEGLESANGDAAALPEPIAPEAPAVTALPEDLEDDRHDLHPGDRLLLVIAEDHDTARLAADVAHENAYKVLIAVRGEPGLALAHEYKPDAIVLSMQLPITEGQHVLDHLKRHPDTRHIPVWVASEGDDRQNVMRAGAVGYVEKPVDKKSLNKALKDATEFLDRRVKSLLVVEDDESERMAIVELIGGGDDVEIVAVGSSEEALEQLKAKPFDCVVLDLKLPDATGFSLLERIKKTKKYRDLPVIIHTGADLTQREETRLRKYAETIIVKDVRSPERLLDETSLFLHRVEARMPVEKRKMLEQLHTSDAVFEGKKVLIVDDDVRNVFALASVFEARGMIVVFAENGKDGIETLQQNPDVDLVLMDIMMPEMDGYETTSAIRQIPEFKQLPIVALTAKAMKGDREKSIASGASDYITKPVDVDQLLSLMRVWLYQ
jgi:CheY-like chemotaxis protein/two-component sensor histidine kinase